MSDDTEQDRRRAAGWYAVGDGRRFFDGRTWVDVEPPSMRRFDESDVPLAVVLGVLAVLAVSLVVARRSVELFGVSTAALVVAVAVSYGPVVGALALGRRTRGAADRTTVAWSARPIDLLWGPVAWLGIVGLQVVAVAALLLADVPIAGNLDRVTDPAGGATDVVVPVVVFVVVFVVAVVVAPLVEELVFRGVVLAGLAPRIGTTAAVVVQAVAFGGAHVDPARGSAAVGTAVILTMVGVGLGVITVATRRLGAAVVAHAIFNGVALAVAWSGVADGIDVNLFSDR
jgi:hypothetical protein